MMGLGSDPFPQTAPPNITLDKRIDGFLQDIAKYRSENKKKDEEIIQLKLENKAIRDQLITLEQAVSRLEAKLGGERNLNEGRKAKHNAEYKANTHSSVDRKEQIKDRKKYEHLSKVSADLTSEILIMEKKYKNLKKNQKSTHSRIKALEQLVTSIDASHLHKVEKSIQVKGEDLKKCRKDNLSTLHELDSTINTTGQAPTEDNLISDLFYLPKSYDIPNVAIFSRI